MVHTDSMTVQTRTESTPDISIGKANRTCEVMEIDELGNRGEREIWERGRRRRRGADRSGHRCECVLLDAVLHSKTCCCTDGCGLKYTAQLPHRSTHLSYPLPRQAFPLLSLSAVDGIMNGLCGHQVVDFEIKWSSKETQNDHK